MPHHLHLLDRSIVPIQALHLLPLALTVVHIQQLIINIVIAAKSRRMALHHRKGRPALLVGMRVDGWPVALLKNYLLRIVMRLNLIVFAPQIQRVLVQETVSVDWSLHFKLYMN